MKKTNQNKINIGLIGYGTVGSGVVKLLVKNGPLFKQKFNKEFVVKTICDRSIHKKDTRLVKNALLTKNIQDVLNDPEINVVIELIGGMNPAEEIVATALKQNKDVITANKKLIASKGRELFSLSQEFKRSLYFESAVGAGIPIIRTITEGVAGNTFEAIYGIINGTCNFILDEMTKKDCTFHLALKEAQKRGYAEKNPTLDINGMDSTHKLAILIHLAFGYPISIDEIYTEGITHISHDDIEYAESLNLSIKLLGIAKNINNTIEARVHPTLIAKDHPLASIRGIYNALYLHMDPLGNILLSGQGAGQMSAASGVISDLVNLASNEGYTQLLFNPTKRLGRMKVRPIDAIQTKFYIRFMAIDKPGVLAKITGILGQYNIGINSVTQKAHNRLSIVPVIMLTDYVTEMNLRLALNEIEKLSVIKGKPVAIRMEKLL